MWKGKRHERHMQDIYYVGNRVPKRKQETDGGELIMEDRIKISLKWGKTWNFIWKLSWIGVISKWHAPGNTLAKLPKSPRKEEKIIISFLWQPWRCASQIPSCSKPSYWWFHLPPLWTYHQVHTEAMLPTDCSHQMTEHAGVLGKASSREMWDSCHGPFWLKDSP